ncbi:hypothetical protein DFP72DRAFT_407108 [Ephemerocybe angulata]|uniref:Uncharacterized protein n=1 Tax=Ephemerocybe angulata TaxID=980116 RepID=A0A8H6HUJ6_9AGAR|nr:hypothetical protein DFP72DRAFT_407108 [Tulosesus angulatus]
MLKRRGRLHRHPIPNPSTGTSQRRPTKLARRARRWRIRRGRGTHPLHTILLPSPIIPPIPRIAIAVINPTLRSTTMKPPPPPPSSRECNRPVRMVPARARRRYRDTHPTRVYRNTGRGKRGRICGVVRAVAGVYEAAGLCEAFLQFTIASLAFDDAVDIACEEDGETDADDYKVHYHVPRAEIEMRMIGRGWCGTVGRDCMGSETVWSMRIEEGGPKQRDIFIDMNRETRCCLIKGVSDAGID